MTGQQLKNSILQMAIQGELVPQDPHDEPASVLLERIREEKKRLVNEGNIKKSELVEKPISEDEIPFDIPEGWEWVRFNQVGDIITGSTPPKDNDDYYGGNIPFYKPTDLDQGINTIASRDSLSKEGFSISRQLPEGSVLVTCIGATIGKTGLIRQVGTCNQQINAIIPNGSIYSDYLYYACISAYIQSEIHKRASSTTLPILNKNKFSEIPIPLPPLPEQHRIVSKLLELMPLIESYGKSQEALNALNASLPEKLRQSILQEAIQGHLVPQDPNEEPASVLLERIRAEKAHLVKEGKLKKKDLEEKPISPDEIPFDIPEGWVWCRLTDIASNSLGKTLNGGKTTGQIKTYLCTINVYWNNIDLSNLKSTAFSENDCVKYRVNPGDLLICEGGDYGRCAVWDIDKEMYYQNALHRVSFYCNVNPYFFMYYIQYCKSAKILDELAKGMTIKHLTQDALYSMFFPLPPLSEQRRIVTKLEELLQEIDKLKA